MAGLFERLRAGQRQAAADDDPGGAPGQRVPSGGSLPERGADRYLGGVASGLAGTVDLDPFVVRLALVLAAVYFPFTIVLYTVAWLVLRDERTHRSLLAGVSEPDGWRAVLGVSALGVGAAVLMDDLKPGGDRSVRFGVVLFVLGLMLVTRATGRSSGDGPADDADGDDGDDDGDPAVDADSSGPTAEDDLVGGGRTPVGPPLVSWPRPSPPPRPPSWLGLLGLSALVLLVGPLTAIDQAWDPVKPGVAVSLGLVLVGVVLLVATWWGRARLLLPIGALLLPLWVGFAVTDVARYEGDGARTYRFGADDPFPEELTHGYGAMDVALDDGALDPGEHRRLRVGLTGGRVQIDVPREVHLRIRGEVGVGRVRVEDHWGVQEQGILFVDGVDMAPDDPADMPENPAELELVLDVGIGFVEVNRV